MTKTDVSGDKAKKVFSWSLKDQSTEAGPRAAVDLCPYCSNTHGQVRARASWEATRGDHEMWLKHKGKLIPASRKGYWNDSPIWVRI